MGSPGLPYVFGPFRHDPEQQALFRGDEAVALAPKAVETLHVLLEHRGRIVKKGELLRLVWPDTVVEDVGLARNISILRKALGDEAEQPVYIETVPRRGYRFIAEVSMPRRQVAAAGPSPHRNRWRLWTIALAAATAVVVVLGVVVYRQFYAPGPYLRQQPDMVATLAVIPFEQLGSMRDDSAFSRGLEESLVASLAKLERIQVISPGTVHRYTDKGVTVAAMSRLLRLDAVVEGTLQQSGSRIRVSARLPDIRSGRLIWAGTHDLEASDRVAAQSAAAAWIAQAVQEHLQWQQ